MVQARWAPCHSSDEGRPAVVRRRTHDGRTLLAEHDRSGHQLMRSLYHLVLRSNRVFLKGTAGGALLPICRLRSRERAEPVVYAVAQQLGCPGIPVIVWPVEYDAIYRELHWACLFDVAASQYHRRLEPVSDDTCDRWALPVQARCLKAIVALTSGHTATGRDFVLRANWPARLQNWLADERVTGSSEPPSTFSVVALAPTRVVVRIPVGRDVRFARVSSMPTCMDIPASQWLSSCARPLTPAPLAVNGDWSMVLQRAVDGTPVLASDRTAVAHLMRTLVEAQSHLQASVASNIHMSRLTAGLIDTTMRRLLAKVCTQMDDALYVERASMVTTLSERLISVLTMASAGAASTWVPLDLDFGNVIMEKGSPQIIDLEESCIGPAPLAVAAFCCGTGVDEASRNHAVDAYVGALRRFTRLEIDDYWLKTGLVQLSWFVSTWRYVSYLANMPLFRGYADAAWAGVQRALARYPPNT